MEFLSAVIISARVLLFASKVDDEGHPQLYYPVSVAVGSTCQDCELGGD